MCMLSQSFELTLSLYIFRPDRESDSEAEDVEHAEKLHQVKAVLEEVINSRHCFFYDTHEYVLYYEPTSN